MSSAALATPGDLPALRQMLAACTEHLAANGWRNWLAFDVAASLESDLLEREVWVLWDGEPRGAMGNDRIVATWTIGTAPLREYPPGFWPADGERVMYLNRLAVDPAQQRRGTGARCMALAAARARKLGCTAIRLDYLAANDGLRHFYTRLGYEPVSDVVRGEWTFTACERRLDGS